ncbi:MAG: putative lipid II flippase FtsW [Alphaproteobacteria bacterium]|nr:putative lipid II flippase FtsW [Alphaproteobacteria bacterium]
MATAPIADTSILGRWWSSIDRWLLAALLILLAVGAVLTLAASPAVASRLGLDSFHFVKRQLGLMPIALGLALTISLLSPRGVRRLGTLLFVVFLGLTFATLWMGVEIKGARRWLHLGGFSLQPSEFLKPCFAVAAAWMFAARQDNPTFPANLMAIALYVAVMAALLAQPDVGMAAVVTAIWAGQFFLAGLSLWWVASILLLGLGGAVAAYLVFPHVASRIDRFLDPGKGDSFQIDRAIEAFGQGGLLGRGPGEGVVKQVLPDAHTDFIFAVAAEEFGLLVCLGIVVLFAFIVLRGLVRALGQVDYFAMLAAAGLMVQFGVQAVINLGVNLHLLPTKGMTLPFVSYGGSSLLALALGIGMTLALTRRLPDAGRLR